ncbi:ABC transporter ATP-binding protein [Aureispira anguillae]|uniref:ABC transporter ATP-binding protein/permease n=1 Tax=Aureispira anguillae TaxID=2864201 RepID=A0A915YAG1_9BACT|nr:ABC transporter ATP-binding protein [Aureispira anguillae]BDS09632.1 ABC transporter ATP-binding protein/permease [Aureispira anguillae]
MQHFWKTIQYLKYYKSYAILNILFNVLAALFTIASFLVLKPFLDILFVTEVVETTKVIETGFIANCKTYFNNTLNQYILDNGKNAGLILVSIIVITTFLFKNLFRYLALYVMVPVRYGIEKRIRQAVFQKLMYLPLSYFSEERKGDLMSRITIDVQEIQWSVLQSVETIVRSPIMIIGSLAVMLYISPLLTGFSFILILFVGLIIGGIAKTLKRKSTAAQESQGRLLSILDEALGGLRIVRAFNAESYQEQNFEAENQYYEGTMTRIMRRKDLSSPLTEFLGVAVVVVLLMFGGSLVFQGVFEASTFVVFITMFYNIIDPAKSFSSAYYAIQKGSAAIERIHQILAHPIHIQDAPDAQAIQQLKTGIEFQNVSFQYNSDRLILDTINLTIPKGQSIAFVGASGAGKSTLIDLIPRFYDIEQGAILLDGINIKDYQLKDLRGLMSMVSQEAILFNDTIYNNIVFGLENISQEEVERAAKIANAHEFIVQLEKGYQTSIGDRGSKLSGGQRQRITIARAILRNPPILILDEATSALDSASERLVQEALFRVMQNRTSIVIAHRLSTIQHVDKIIVLQDGKIVEQGKHEELLAVGGIYQQLVKLQAM